VVLSTGSPEEARGAAGKADHAGSAYLDAGLQTTLAARNAALSSRPWRWVKWASSVSWSPLPRMYLSKSAA